MAMIIKDEFRHPEEPTGRPHVIVVGGGVAGMAAAHRLLERGHDVTMLEADSFLGGKLGAHQEADDLRQYNREEERSHQFGARDCTVCTVPCCKEKRADDWHEHCYHMYLNWYHNFWGLMRDVGVIDRFEPFVAINNLVADPDADVIRSINPGSPWTVLQNLTCGVSDPEDVFLYNMSILDLLGTPDYDDQRLDKMSVAAFQLERGYTTTDSRKATKRVLAKAFAAPTAMASARTYKSFLKYGAKLPDPTMWLLNGQTQEAIFTPWLKKLAELSGNFDVHWRFANEPKPFLEAKAHHQRLERTEAERATMPSFKLWPLFKLAGMEIDPDTGEFLLLVEGLVRSPTVQPEQEVGASPFQPAVWRFDGQVVLTVPPRQLGNIVFRRAKHDKADPKVCLFGNDPSLGKVTKLDGAPIMTLDVRFRKQLDKPLPKGITLLLDSKFEMSVYDNSQIWRGESEDNDEGPMVSICASDAHELMPFVGMEGGAEVIVDMLLAELRRYVRFDPEADILQCRTHLQTNAGEELFINAVDTWNNRPKTTTLIPDLFIAGDFVQTPIDVVTIEGAATSGLMAAEAVRRRTGHGRPVEIITPDANPNLAMKALANMTRPLAYGAKAMSVAQSGLKRAFDETFPDD